MQTRRAPFLTEADGQHLRKAAFDPCSKIRVRLDAIDRHDHVAPERRFAYVDRPAATQLPDLFDFHRGIDRDVERLRHHPKFPQHFHLPGARSAAVGPHGRYEHGGGAGLSQGRDYDSGNLGEPGDPSAPQGHPHSLASADLFPGDGSQLRRQLTQVEHEGRRGPVRLIPIEVVDRRAGRPAEPSSEASIAHGTPQTN